jgi:hypothetical protein
MLEILTCRSESSMRGAITSLFVSGWLLCAARAEAEPRAEGDEQALRGEAHRARVWRYTWSGINAGILAGSFVAAPLVAREDRPDWVVSGVGSGISLLATWFWPLRVESAADELDALPLAERARELPRLLRESAEDERERVTWPWHLANLGLSAAGGAVIAFGYHHYLSGAITTVAATALGEVQLFTQPTGLRDVRTVSLSLVPRLTFTPRVGGAPSAWTVSVAGAF